MRRCWLSLVLVCAAACGGSTQSNRCPDTCIEDTCCDFTSACSSGAVPGATCAEPGLVCTLGNMSHEWTLTCGHDGVYECPAGQTCYCGTHSDQKAPCTDGGT